MSSKDYNPLRYSASRPDNRTRYTSNTSDSFDSEDFQSEDASLTTSQEENLRSTTDGIPSVTLDLSEPALSPIKNEDSHIISVGDYEEDEDEDEEQEAEETNDSQVDIWALVEKMCDELASFSTDGDHMNIPKVLEAPATRLRALLDMHKKIGERSKTLKMVHVGLLMECKLYLEFLRNIESVGKKAKWDSPFLQQVRTVLHPDNNQSKSVK